MNENAQGMFRILIFLIVLMIAFWGINAYKHHKIGCTKAQKMLDATGALMLAGLLAAAVIPLLKK